ncbi:MAG: hypothetical protein H0V18_11460 [Pyrinomonadaceae bacterium]|nr:hypothetical protein [Pyrinomonadaceae bacterium]
MNQAMSSLANTVATILLVFTCAWSQETREPQNSAVTADNWLDHQERVSWDHMQKNISPTEPKTAGGPQPQPGIVVGALSKKDPDYYFHWVRDSAHVMAAVADEIKAKREFVQAAPARQWIKDFLQLSRRLQKTDSPVGMGEPRFTVEGKADTLAWSRPQYDGPALRALAVMKMLPLLDAKSDRAWRDLALQVLKTDLDFVVSVYRKRGFDVWEEYNAENYHTRLVQLAALDKGQRYVKSARYRKAVADLEKVLDDHWDPARGFLRSQVVIVATDGYTSKKTDLDSAVVVAVVDADRESGAHSVMDDRVQATVHVLENLFRAAYPINQREDLGLAYGRYPGDTYYGGNPWFLISSDYATFYFRIVHRMKHGVPLTVSGKNADFLKAILPEVLRMQVKPGMSIAASDPLGTALIAGLMSRADGIVKRLQTHTPPDGQIFEQIDKVSGKPVSSPGIGWGHSALMTAALARRAAVSSL